MELSTEALPVAARGPAFEVKGTIAPVTVLCLRTVDVARIDRELAARVAPAPQMFLHAPCVIDVADVEDAASPLPLAEIVRVVRAYRLNPVGLAHLPASEVQRAADVGLAVVQLGFGRSKMARRNAVSPEGAATLAPLSSPVAELVAQARAAAEVKEEPPAATPVETAAEATEKVAAPANEERECKTGDGQPATGNEEVRAPVVVVPTTMTVKQAVRGGQVVYGKADVVVVAPVNPGAQIIADGHVHVYGRLRGRALAGAHGNKEARVFCSALEAELISIAGEFLTADAIPSSLRGKPAQIWIEHGELRVAAL